MRVVFTGQTGINKKAYLDGLKEYCEARRKRVEGVFSVGDVMYAEAQKSGQAIREGKILDLPQAELAILRRAAFGHITHQSSQYDNVLLGSHAVFRWNYSLFPAFAVPEVETFCPDALVTLVDDIDAIKLRLDGLKASGELPDDINYTLKDLLVWREEEILASEILASMVKVPHYILGCYLDPAVSVSPYQVAFAIMFEPWKKKAYVSYPISDAMGRPEIWDKVVRFRGLTAQYLAAFDPLIITEKRLQSRVTQAQVQDPNATTFQLEVRGGAIELQVDETKEVILDVDGQIVARDYKLIDQADLIVAYFPVGPDGNPLIAGGVVYEIEHAKSATKDIILVWESERDPTPFIGIPADHICRSLGELESYLGEISGPIGQLEMPLQGNG